MTESGLRSQIRSLSRQKATQKQHHTGSGEKEAETSAKNKRKEKEERKRRGRKGEAADRDEIAKKVMGKKEVAAVKEDG